MFLTLIWYFITLYYFIVIISLSVCLVGLDSSRVYPVLYIVIPWITASLSISFSLFSGGEFLLTNMIQSYCDILVFLILICISSS